MMGPRQIDQAALFSNSLTRVSRPKRGFIKKNLVEATNRFSICRPSRRRNLFSSGTPASDKAARWGTAPANPTENVMKRRRVMTFLANAAHLAFCLQSMPKLGAKHSAAGNNA
jgi:hypothetical protein